MNTYNRYPLTIVKGRGCWVWDDKNTKYLDAVSGIATCSLGHSDRVLRRALFNQLKKIQHVSNLYQISEQKELGNWLVKNSCCDRVFFCNSGAEANEAAIKLARKFAHIKKNIEHPTILTARESFHGRTLATLSATGQSKYQKGFEPLVDGFSHFNFNDFGSFKTLYEKIESERAQTVAVLIEPIQGEGGIKPGDVAFFRKLRDFCDKEELLLIFDEVQSGMGRTGYLWGYQTVGVEPDAFTLAKGLGGGHAIGAFLSKKEFDVFQPGDHASTFGGNPFACRAALTVCEEIIRRDLLKNVNRRGQQLKESLMTLVKKYPKILEEVRGLGLIQGLVINSSSSISSTEIVKVGIQKKVLLVGAGSNVVRLVPPLTIKKHEIVELVKRLNSVLEHFT